MDLKEAITRQSIRKECFARWQQSRELTVLSKRSGHYSVEECQEVKGLKHLSAKILGLTGGLTDDIWDGSPGMEVFWPTSNNIGRRDSGNVEEALGWIPRLEKLGETFSKDFGTDWWSSHDILEGSQGMKGFCDTMDLAFHARFHSQALFHTAADMVCSSTCYIIDCLLP
ncbi:hypothetical protein MG293_005345 [Ovis ammon polii]|uniref:Uncharacterized protein n=1 Tax=Ovis ammon polii TaxID=230172 RepID=A0AAD4YEJ7_OVIAM|nr:hypothetical protein MG293_005345 [Ovis ammon polii]